MCELCDSAPNFKSVGSVKKFLQENKEPVDTNGVLLNEGTYKELSGLLDDEFLSQRVRAAALKEVKYVGWDEKNKAMEWNIRSSEFNKEETHGYRRWYKLLVKFAEWDEVGPDPDLTWAEKSRLLLWVGDCKLDCSCPSMTYHYRWVLDQYDSSVFPETRRPNVTNPSERGIVCKHGRIMLQVLPFNSTVIAQELKEQFDV